jgi:hypothetical protein
VINRVNAKRGNYVTFISQNILPMLESGYVRQGIYLGNSQVELEMAYDGVRIVDVEIIYAVVPDGNLSPETFKWVQAWRRNNLS